MTLKSLLLPALAAAGLVSAPALADDAQTRTVTIDRAALTTPSGAEAVYADVRAAASAACRAENRGGAAFDRSVRICTQDTLERAVNTLDAPLLSALHDAGERAIRLASTP